MASRTLPNLGLAGFFDLGEDGWKDGMDLNLLLLSCLVQGGVLSTVSATPGSPSDGDIHIFDGAHPTQANKIAIRDAGSWVYVTPLEGWKLFDREANVFVYFTGTDWVEFTAGGGGSGSSAVETISAASSNLLATDVNKYLRFTDSGTKTLTVRPEATHALPANGEWHIRNAATGDLTIAEGSGVVINPPTGGTLIVPNGGTVTLKRVEEDVFDLLGQTVAV